MAPEAATAHDVVHLHDVACVAHVHSTWSDGTATISEIAAAAGHAGARVVLLTDHDTLAARRAGEERRHGDVLVVIGHEVTSREGHLLVFGSEHEIAHAERTGEEIAEAADSAGAVSFAAHPFSRGSRISPRIGRAHPWTALERTHMVGIELWSLVTDLAEDWTGPASAVRSLRRPEAFIDGPRAEHLVRWDALGRRRCVAAIGGLDAHQPGVRIRGRLLSVMPHRRWFRLLQTHALLEVPLRGDPRLDAERVLEALAAGRSFLSVEAFAPAAGFVFWAERDGVALPMGGEAAADRWTLRIRLPRPARLRLVRDGRVIADDVTDALERPVAEPGVYRVEARLATGGRERTWILSNPIYLRA